MGLCKSAQAIIKRLMLANRVFWQGLPKTKKKFKYDFDGLATNHNHDFMKTAKFKEAFALAEKFLLADGMYWRTYIVCWFANYCKGLRGDFVECGVYQGGFARAIESYINFSSLNKKFFLIDTFEGLSDKYSSDSEKEREAEYKRYTQDNYNLVSSDFSDKTNFILKKGVIPDVLEKIQFDKVAYLSIDMNSAIPEKAALDFFWDKLDEGGVIILDDYGWAGYEGQKKVHDEFAQSKGLEILSLPTGQGIIIKPLTF